MANLLIARPQAATKAEAQASPQANSTVTAATATSPQGKNLLAAKKEFDATLELAKKANQKDEKTPPTDPTQAEALAAAQMQLQAQFQNSNLEATQLLASTQGVAVPPAVKKTDKSAANEKTAELTPAQLMLAKAAMAQDSQLASQAAVKTQQLKPVPTQQGGPNAPAAIPGLEQMMQPVDHKKVLEQQGTSMSPEVQAILQGLEQHAQVSVPATLEKPTPVGPASTLSSQDYLNLRNLSAASAKKQNTKLTLNPNELGSATGTVGAFAAKDGHAPMKVIDATVTTGSMQKNVLTHDSIQQLTHQVNFLNQAKQDGEMKIRLRPDHLGELQMSVKNRGQEISIKIQAETPEARQIIESSLSTLRERLSQQNLTVSRMEITQAPTPIQAATQDGGAMQLDLGQFRQQQQQQESFGNRNDWRDENLGNIKLNPVPSALSRAAVQSRTSSSSGLDLIA